MAILCSLLAVCSVSAQGSRQEGTNGQAAIYRLPLSRLFAAPAILKAGIRKAPPICGLGASGAAGERYSARTMTKRQADALLRKDLRKFCAMFRKFGRDSLLATLAYNVGPYRLLGSGRYPKAR